MLKCDSTVDKPCLIVFDDCGLTADSGCGFSFDSQSVSQACLIRVSHFDATSFVQTGVEEAAAQYKPLTADQQYSDFLREYCSDIYDMCRNSEYCWSAVSGLYCAAASSTPVCTKEVASKCETRMRHA
jgi:hypothetical protein